MWHCGSGNHRWVGRTLTVLYQNGNAVHAQRKLAAPLKLDGVALYVRGTMNDWGLGDRLKLSAPNMYVATVMLAKGDYRFKVASEDWKAVDLGGSVAEPLVPGTPAALHQLGADMTLSVPSPARYIFTVDASTPSQPQLNIKAM